MIWIPKKRILRPRPVECAMLGLGLGFGGGRAVASDPMAPVAAMNLSLYLDGADYSAGTWTGRASAGTSGSHNATTDGSNPTVGATLNGIPTVSFAAASSHRLVFSSTINNYVSTTAWSAWALVNLTSETTNNTSYYDNACLVADTGSYFSCGVKSGGPTHGVTQFGGSGGTAQATFTNGAWQLLQWKYDGTNLKARTNSGAWVSAAETAIANVTGTGVIGCNYNKVAFLNGLVASLGASTTTLSDANFDTIKTALNSRFGLAL